VAVAAVVLLELEVAPLPLELEVAPLPLESEVAPLLLASGVAPRLQVSLADLALADLALADLALVGRALVDLAMDQAPLEVLEERPEVLELEELLAALVERLGMLEELREALAAQLAALEVPLEALEKPEELEELREALELVEQLEAHPSILSPSLAEELLDPLEDRAAIPLCPPFTLQLQEARYVLNILNLLTRKLTIGIGHRPRRWIRIHCHRNSTSRSCPSCYLLRRGGSCPNCEYPFILAHPTTHANSSSGRCYLHCPGRGWTYCYPS
jgi:hypothetical protein